MSDERACGQGEVATFLEHLNYRFRFGRPSDSYEFAGVFLHQFDAAPSSHVYVASVVNANGAPRLPSASSGGLVLNPHVLQPRGKPAAADVVQCIFAMGGVEALRDPCTSGPKSRLHGCIPGCTDGQGRGSWCGAGAPYGQLPLDCAWGAEELQRMMEQHQAVWSQQQRQQEEVNEQQRHPWTEIAIPAVGWAKNMPDIVEAVFVPANASSGERQRAIEFHRSLLRRFGLVATQMPLLTLDLARRGKCAPFTPLQAV